MISKSVELKITGNPVVCYVKVIGINGKVREYLAAISPASRYCVMRRVDAESLGIATLDLPLYPFRGSVEMAGSLEGIIKHEVIKVPRIVLGDLEATKVETMIVESAMPEAMGIDVVLGAPFFSDKKLTMDYKRGNVIIKDLKGSPK